MPCAVPIGLGTQTLTTPGRTIVQRLAATFAAAALLAVAMPAVAPLDVRAADSAAAGDRLIVLWKEQAPETLTVRGVR